MASSDYRNIHITFENKGLDLIHPVDMVPPGKWTSLNNVRSTQEGLLQTREGAPFFINNTAAGNTIQMRRLDASTVLVQAGTEIYRNAALVSTGWQNIPTSMVRFKPALSADNWMYVSDGVQMQKIRSDGTQYQWGITPPANAAVFGVNGSGSLDSSVAGATNYDWRYTYYSSITGAESNPSPTATAISAVSQAVDVSVQASTDPQVTNIRIYRRGGTIPTSWKLVTTIANTTTVYNDGAADATILFSLSLDINKDQPFTTTDTSGNFLFGTALPIIWGPFIGQYLFAVGDTVRPNYIYWTNPGDPDSASSANNLQVSSPGEDLINGFVYDANSYVFTRDNLYTLDFGGPLSVPTFQPRKIPLGIGLAAKYGLVIGPAGVFFVGKDNIYMTDCTNSASPVSMDIRPLFRGLAANGFQPVDFTQENSIRLAYVGMELHFFYKDTDGNQEHLFYDVIQQRWQQFSISGRDIFMGYGDENQPGYQLLLGASEGDVIRANVPGNLVDLTNTAISGECRTGAIDCGIPMTFKEWGNALIDIDSGGSDVIVTPFTNGDLEVQPAQTINAPFRQKIPISLNDVYAYNISFDFTWNGLIKLYGIEVLWRDDEEAVKHWECPPTSHGLPGWQHVRDGYIGIRSTADVTMTINIDGVDYTYNVPSTSGERRKVYVEFRPVKGKMFQYKFDSSGIFRLYGEDTQLNVKSWQTALGYKPIFPFPSVGMAPFLRREAGT